MQFHKTILACLATASVALGANIRVNNWCTDQIQVAQSVAAGADEVIADIPAGDNDTSIPWTNGVSTALKFSRPGINGVLQFEYTNQEAQIWWDLSDLDGSGAGHVGSPFFTENVRVTPTGSGSGENTCQTIRCASGQTCADSYQHPDDQETRNCPSNTGDMWIDLCEPVENFVARRHYHDKHLRRHAVHLHSRK